MNIAMERGSLVAIVSFQESKFFLYKYAKNGPSLGWRDTFMKSEQCLPLIGLKSRLFMPLYG